MLAKRLLHSVPATKTWTSASRSHIKHRKHICASSEGLPSNVHEISSVMVKKQNWFDPSGLAQSTQLDPVFCFVLNMHTQYPNRVHRPLPK